MTQRGESSSRAQVTEEGEAEIRFSFRFTIFEVSAMIKAGRLIVHQGMKTSVVELDQIRYIYARDMRERELSELTIASEHQGKLKRARIYADCGSSGFDALRAYLIALNPSSDISKLPLKAAYQKMGSRNIPWIAIPSVMAIGTLLIALFTSPLLIHGLDTGHETLNLDALYKEANSGQAIKEVRETLTSRHVTLNGWLDTAHAWSSSGDAGASLFYRPSISEQARPQVSSDHKLFVPVYPQALEASADRPPARLVITVTGEGASRLLESSHHQHTGILRDLVWEGIGWRARQGLNESGVTLSEGALIIELGVTRRDDLFVYLMIVGLFSVMTWLVFMYLKPPRLSVSN